MREIKFRAWDKKEKKMILPMGKVQPTLAYINFHDLTAQAIFYRWELMQYTGLQDSKGKEIYEGDLIGEKGYFVEVIFRDGAFANPIDGNPIIDWIYARSRRGIDTEVIGNIYEDEALLKGGEK